MKMFVSTLTNLIVITFLLSFALYAQNQNAPGGDSPSLMMGSHFMHTATPSNIFFNYTIIDNPITNNKPSALVFVEQNWNPNDTGGTYNDHHIGVWYTGGNWSVFNEDVVGYAAVYWL